MDIDSEHTEKEGILTHYELFEPCESQDGIHTTVADFIDTSNLSNSTNLEASIPEKDLAWTSDIPLDESDDWLPVFMDFDIGPAAAVIEQRNPNPGHAHNVPNAFPEKNELKQPP